jgi:hypothetical protein
MSSKPLKRTKVRPQKQIVVLKESKTKVDKSKSQKSPIYQSLKEVIPGGIKFLGDAIEPGLGTLGSLVTKKAMDWFGKVTGFGDYTVKSNSLIANPTGGPPLFGTPGFRVRDKEFVKFIKVPSNGNFKVVDKFWLNPSNPVLFPKLSIKAQLYQLYKMHGMIIYLESCCSESITTTGGDMSIPTALVCTKYNLKEKDFANESQMMNSFFCSDKRINKDLYHPIECDASQAQVDKLYTWAHDPEVGFTRDPNLQDMGATLVAFVGGQQTTEFKAYKMYVDYDVEFFKPIYNTQPELSDHYKLTACVAGQMFDGVDVTTSSSSYSDPQKLYSVAGNVITFNDNVYGLFEITYQGYYSLLGVTAGFAPTLAGGVSALTLYNNGTASDINNIGDTSLVLFRKIAVNVKGGGTITLTDVSGINWTRADVFIESLENLSN